MDSGPGDKKLFKEFLEGIPDNKLQGFPPGDCTDTLYPKPIRRGDNYRLDKQGFTQNGYYNIQIQANNNAKSASVKARAPKTVAAVLILEGSEPPVTPAEVREAFWEYYRSYHRKYNPSPDSIELGTAPPPPPPPPPPVEPEIEAQTPSKSMAKWNDTRKNRQATASSRKRG